LGLADDAMSLAKLTGDLVIAAFFSASKDRQRIERLNALARQLVKYMSKQGRIEDVLPLDEAVNELHTGNLPIELFHWEIEFPEVFGRESSGFDAMVGNPPFAGKNTLINSHRDGYLDWLKTIHEESHGNADLVAHFYRRAFNLLRQDGCFGMIATNTIGQGDTRSSLTKTYNRVHDPYERSPEIQKLRELHDAMDRAVLDAYGWTDLVSACEFLLDYEEDEDDEGGASRRKKPWRYRWPDDFRDEVLARLLALNKQRAEQERLAGLVAEAAAGMSQGHKKLSSTAMSRRKQSAPNTAQPDLLGL
jgi:hypothetical protein